MAISYKELGLVNTREMFAKAVKGGYAIPAYNFNNMEQLQAIIQACVETSSPVILQVSSGARKYANATLLRHMARGAVEYAKELGKAIPIVLHLDHGDTYELCVDCIESGFSSVMIDGSHHPYEKNVELTRKVVEYAHRFDVTVEGELGVLAGVEDDVKAEQHTYTEPDQVEDFVKKTGVDSLAIAIGTSHGAFKFKPGSDPKIRLDILREVERRIPGFPIVLHGASSVPRQIVEEINAHGGKLKDAIGIGEDHSEGGRAQRRLQDQHRLRRAARHDGGHPEGVRREPPGSSTPEVPGAGAGRPQGAVQAQDRERPRLGREGVKQRTERAASPRPDFSEGCGNGRERTRRAAA